MPRPKLKGYPRETVVAEKFEAMINLEMLNSRMKDFYDIWLLANQFDFDGQTLGKALTKTFARRKKELMLKFGSLRAIRAASIEELASVKGMDRAAALSIKENL